MYELTLLKDASGSLGGKTYQLNENKPLVESLLSMFPNGLPKTARISCCNENICLDDLISGYTPRGDVTILIKPAFFAESQPIQVRVIGGSSAGTGTEPISNQIPAEVPESRNITSNSTNSFSAQGNVSRIGERIPDIYGELRVYPDLLSESLERYTDENGNSGKKSAAGRTLYKNSRKRITQLFITSMGDGEVVNGTERIGDGTFPTAATLEDVTGITKVVDYPFNIPTSENQIVFDYLQFDKLNLFRRADFFGNGAFENVVLFTMLNGVMDLTISSLFGSPATNDDAAFFAYCFENVKTGDELVIGGLNADQSFKSTLEGTYAFKRLSITQVAQGQGFGKVSILLDKISGDLNNIGTNIIGTATAFSGAFIQGKGIRGNLRDAVFNEVERLEKYELPHNLNTTVETGTEYKASFDLFFSRGLDTKFTDEPMVGAVYEVVESFYDTGSNDWLFLGTGGISEYTFVGWAEEGEQIRGTITHTMSSEAILKSRAGFRMSVSIRRTKTAVDNGIGFNGAATLPDENGSNYVITPPDYFKFSTLEDNQDFYVTDSIITRVTQVISKKTTFNNHTVEFDFKDTTSPQSTSSGALNFIFKRDITIFDVNGDVISVGFSNDVRQIVLNYMSVTNKIPISTIDVDALFDIGSLDGDFDLNIALTNKSNTFEKELSIMLQPFFAKSIRSGGGYTFGSEFDSTGSKDVSSIITGRIAELNNAAISYSLSSDDPVTAIDVEFKDGLNNIYDIKVFRIKKLGVTDPKVKKISLVGITKQSQAEFFAKITFNKLVMQRRSTSVNVNSSMLSLNPFDRVRMADPTYFDLTFVDGGGTSNNFNSQEAELIGLDGIVYTLSEKIKFPEGGIYVFGEMNILITNEFGEIDNAEEFRILPLSGLPSDNLLDKVIILDSSQSIVTNFTFRGQVISPLAGATQVGARISATPIPVTPNDNSSKLDDYLITGIVPATNNTVKVNLIEYNELFYKPDALASETEQEIL